MDRLEVFTINSQMTDEHTQRHKKQRAKKQGRTNKNISQSNDLCDSEIIEK